MKRLILTSILSVFLSIVGFAQMSPTSDEAAMPYKPEEIVADFMDRKNNPTPENAFIDKFFKDYDVPTEGQFNWDLEKTWTWWVGTNEAAIEEYLIRRKKNHDTFNQ